MNIHVEESFVFTRIQLNPSLAYDYWFSVRYKENVAEESNSVILVRCSMILAILIDLSITSVFIFVEKNLDRVPHIN